MDDAERLRKLRDALLTGLVERDVAIRLALLAALAGEHMLMLGPPGTAKSLVAHRLRLAFKDSTYFERLLTRFTVPEELFGPLSIKGLEDDRYERLTEAYLPQASIAFLDEIFKANSAILNALLTILNERQFDNGARREEIPLIAVIGASNEMPDETALEALYDRFLLRLHVGPVSADGFVGLLKLRGQADPDVCDTLKLTACDVAEIQSLAEEVDVPDDVVSMLSELRVWCTGEQIPVSDRRWRKIVKLLQVAAWTNGRDKVSIWDCWLLQHCLWNEPEDRVKIYDWYASRVGASAAMDPSRLTRIVVVWESRLKADQDSRSQARDDQNRSLFRGIDGKPTTNKTGEVQAKRGDELLYLQHPDCRSRSFIVGQDERLGTDNGYTISELNSDRIYVRDTHSDQRGYWESGGSREIYFEKWSGRNRYLADPNNWVMEEVSLQPFMEPTQQRVSYIDDCLNQIEEVQGSVAKYKRGLGDHIGNMKDEIMSHLWITNDFVEIAAKNLEKTREEVDALRERVRQLKKGFKNLPREQQFNVNEEEPGLKRLNSFMVENGSKEDETISSSR